MRTQTDVLRSLKRYVAHVLGDSWEVRLWDEPGTFDRPFARVARATSALPTNRVHHIEYVMPCVVHLYHGGSEMTIEQAIAGAEAAEQLLTDGFEIGVSYTEKVAEPLGLAVEVDASAGALTGNHGYVVTAVTAADGETVASVAVSAGIVGTHQNLVTWGIVPQAVAYRIYRATGVLTVYERIVEVPVELDDGEGPLPRLEWLDTGALTPGPEFPPDAVGADAEVTVRGEPRRFPLYDHDDVDWEGAAADTTRRFTHDYVKVLDLSTNRLHDPVDERLISVVCDIRCGWRRLGRVPSGTKLLDAVQTEFINA